MRYNEINEARRNPDQNPKVSVNQAIRTRLKNTTDSVAQEYNLFVSFTEVDKLGINPQSKYDTPLGIYAYPADYVMQKLGDEREARYLPFAGDSKFANIFKVRGNIIDIGTVTFDVVRGLYKLIADYAAKEMVGKVYGASWKLVVDAVEKFINQADTHSRFPDFPGGQLWYVSMKTAEFMARNLKNKKTPVMWNQLFRAIGIDGIIDGTGIGIIHTSEPTQAVFFSTQVIFDNERVHNKYSPEHVTKRQKQGNQRDQEIRKFVGELPKVKTAQELSHLLDVSGMLLINKVPPGPLRTQVIVNHPTLLALLKRSTPEEQYEAIVHDPMAAISEIPPEYMHQDAIAQAINDLPTLPRFFGNKIPKQSPAVQIAVAKKDPLGLPENPIREAIVTAISSGLNVTDRLIADAHAVGISTEGYYSYMLVQKSKGFEERLTDITEQLETIAQWREKLKNSSVYSNEKELDRIKYYYNANVKALKESLAQADRMAKGIQELIAGKRDGHDYIIRGSYIKLTPEFIQSINKKVQSNLEFVNKVWRTL